MKLYSCSLTYFKTLDVRHFWYQHFSQFTWFKILYHYQKSIKTIDYWRATFLKRTNILLISAFFSSLNWKSYPSQNKMPQKEKYDAHIVIILSKNMQNRFIWNIIELDGDISTHNNVMNKILIGGGTTGLSGFFTYNKHCIFLLRGFQTYSIIFFCPYTIIFWRKSSIFHFNLIIISFSYMFKELFPN